jgi:hypothetical protein
MRKILYTLISSVYLDKYKEFLKWIFAYLDKNSLQQTY